MGLLDGCIAGDDVPLLENTSNNSEFGAAWVGPDDAALNCWKSAKPSELKQKD